MKTRTLLALTCVMLLVGFLPLSGVRVLYAQDPEPGDPVVTGNPGLTRSVRVFPYDVDLYGIYLVNGDQMSLVTSVPVEHVNLDRVTAKFSPDGQKVAYLVEYGSNGFSKLVVVGVDGLNTNTLFESDNPERYITSFQWSHDSNRVAYSLSRDTFAAGEGTAAFFADPESEPDPEEETQPFDEPAELSGEVWMTDLSGEEQTQLVDQGAMGVLGWTGDDSSVLFTNYVTETDYVTETSGAQSFLTSSVTDTRIITPTAPVAASVATVQATATTTPAVSTLVLNDLSETPSQPIYYDFQLLEADDGSQKLAALGTESLFDTMPFSSTTLALASLDGLTARTANRPMATAMALALTPVLTNSSAIASVSLSPDGVKLAYLTEQEGALWTADISGTNHTDVITAGLEASDQIVWGSSNDALAAASLGDYQVQVFRLNGDPVGSLSVVLDDDFASLSGSIVRNYDATYIHQLWDTPDWFNGGWACGSTSAAMALAFYQKLTPHPITVSYPTPHTSNYGYYIPEKFPGFNTQWAYDASGHKAYGLYAVSNNGHTYAGREWIQTALNKLGLQSSYNGWSTFDKVKAALDRGHLVILSTKLTGTKLTSTGHIVLVRGYTSDGHLIVNDPYGNKHAGHYGRSSSGRNGGNIQYTWNYMHPGWYIEVKGTPPGGGAPTITHWKGEYFDNRTLSGQPSLIRNDVNVNFNWGSSAPASSIPADNFSVRWTRTLRFDRGTYRFRIETDDGARLYVDGRRIVNAWYDQGTTAHESGDIYLRSGSHTIKMEYYEHGGAAVAKLSWRKVGSGSGGNGWTAQYYNNRNLSGSPTFTRNDDSIYFNWRYGGPGNGVGNDNFSVRWNKTLNIPRSGYYRLYTRTDDGVKAWVDNHLRIWSWYDQPARTHHSSWMYLSKGNHAVKVEYYEHGGAAYARVWLQPAFRAEYYNNRYLSGSPGYTRYETSVWHKWYSGSPNWRIPRDNFSARWTGNAALSGGRYKFCVRSDDGVRLYLDGSRVINRWYDHGARTYCTYRNLSKGFHEIKMEYYEHGGWAEAKLWWSKLGGVDSLGSLNAMAYDDATDPTEEDIMALYGDAGYLGPLTESDVTDAEPGIYDVFLPMVVRCK